MASVGGCDTDQQVDGAQEPRRVTIVLGDVARLISQAPQDANHSTHRTTRLRHLCSSSKSTSESVESFRPSAGCRHCFLRCCWFAPCTFSFGGRCTSNRLAAVYAKLSGECPFRTLLLLYVCLNELLRYHNGGGSLSVAAGVSEALLVFLLLVEFVYDSISLGLWRGQTWFFRSRRCVYNFIVLVLATACGILDVVAKTKPTWYNAEVAFIAALGRFIRLFRVYQSQWFLAVHSIFKKSSFNLLTLAGLGFMFALFYAIIFFHLYGYTQFNLCYKEPVNAGFTGLRSNGARFTAPEFTEGGCAGRTSATDQSIASKWGAGAPQSSCQDAFGRGYSNVRLGPHDARASSSGFAKDTVCDAKSAYWDFDTGQQFLCTPGRACHAGTQCRNAFLSPSTYACSKAERQQLHRAAWDLIFENPVNDWGTTGFHSGISTLTSLLMCVTLEGWSSLMYRQADGDATSHGVVSFVLFLSVVILGNLMLMNLVVAVVWENTILKSTPLKRVDVRDEDLQLFEILGMRWVRHLVQQLSRHFLFKSEEKMVAYQCAKNELQRENESHQPSNSTAFSSTTPVCTTAAAESHRNAAGSAWPTGEPSAANSCHNRSACVSPSENSFASFSPASVAVACDTRKGPSSRCGMSPGSAVSAVEESVAPVYSRANATYSPRPSPFAARAGAGAPHALASRSSGALAVRNLRAPTVATIPVEPVFSCRHNLWSRIRCQVLNVVSRKQYVTLMCCTSMLDLCCTVALTWMRRESAQFVTDCVFTLTCAIDVSLQLIGFGWHRFLRDGFKVYDLTVVLIEVSGLLFHASYCGAPGSWATNCIHPSNSTLYSVHVFFRSLHTFRTLRLIRFFAPLRILVELMYDLLRNILFIYSLVLFEVFIISVMGVICFSDSYYEIRAHNLGFPTITLFFNFSNIWKAFILVYGLMTGESWNVVMSEFFAVYADHDYLPSEEETMLPSQLFLKSPRPAYIITTYVFITVIFLCCFIFNFFCGILIGQYLISRRSVYHRHVFKMLTICRDLGIEMPSPDVVGSANLQRMYSLARPHYKGMAAGKRALSLFLHPERIQQRFSVAGASPMARKIMTRVSSSFAKSRPSSMLVSNTAQLQAAREKPRKTAAATRHFTARGSRDRQRRRVWRVLQSRRGKAQLRSPKARALPGAKQEQDKPSRRPRSTPFSEATSPTSSHSHPPLEPPALPSNKTVWAISRSAQTQSFLLYTVSHENFAQTPKEPPAGATIWRRICQPVRSGCLALAFAVVRLLDAAFRLFSFCLMLLEKHLVPLDIDRPDFCVAHVRYILKDEDTLVQEGECMQESSASISSNNLQQLHGSLHASTCSNFSKRRVTANLHHFKPAGCLHSFLYRLMVSSRYDYFIATVNVTSLLCLVIEACLKRNAHASFCFACLEFVFAGFFLLESVLRMFVLGLLMGTIRMNILNFALTLVSVVLLLCNNVWLLSPSLQKAYGHFWETPAFRTVKVLRSMRALYLIDTLRIDGIKIVARSLVASIGEMRNLAALLVLVFIVAAVFMTHLTYLLGATSRTRSVASVSFLGVPSSGREGRGGLQTEGTAFPAHIIHSNLEIMAGRHTKRRDLAYSMQHSAKKADSSPPSSDPFASYTPSASGGGADGRRAAPYTFDNMVEALMAVFVLSTAEGWPLLLARLLQQQPDQQRTIVTVLILVFVSLIAIFCVNLFVGIIVEVSRKKKTRMELQGSLLTPAIHKWIEVQKILFDAPLQHGNTIPDFDSAGHKRVAWMRKRAAVIVTSSYYHYFDLSQIFVFSFLLVFYGPWYDVLMGHIAPTTDRVFCSIAVILCCCFIAGVVLKLVARGRFFFRDKLDILDFLICFLFMGRIVVAVSLNGQWMHLTAQCMSTFWPLCFRLFRVARFLYRHVSFFRTLFTTITGVARAFLTALGLLGIALFFFALWGVLLFHDSPIQGYTNKYTNFTNLGAAFMAVIGACTGEDWHVVLQQMRLHYEYEGKTALEYFVVIFFVAFIILVFFTLMSLFTSTVLEKYMETVRNDSLWKISRQHRRLLDLWIPEEDGTLFKSLEDTLHILQSIDFPIGLRNANPPVETSQAAFAFLAKFELPLYYCNKAEGTITRALNKCRNGAGTGASYKAHIRDVVLNAARRACKFYAMSNGEGVLQEGRVALDARVTQSWVAKFPELNRVDCVYDLNHFNAATTIQQSWRRRHLCVNGHIASPDWCERYIVSLMLAELGTRSQLPSSRSRRGSQNEPRRDIFIGERERGRKSSADSNCGYKSVGAHEADSTRHKKRHTAVNQEKILQVFHGSRRPSLAPHKSIGEKETPKHQLATHSMYSRRSPRASVLSQEAPTRDPLTKSMSARPGPASVATQIVQRGVDGIVDAFRVTEGVQKRATNAEGRPSTAGQCPASTSFTRPSQTCVYAHPAECQQAPVAGGSAAHTHVRSDMTHSARKFSSVSTCPPITASACVGQTNVRMQPAQSDTDASGSISAGGEDGDSDAAGSGSGPVRAAAVLAATSGTCADQLDPHALSAQYRADNFEALLESSGQLKTLVITSGCQSDGAAQYLAAARGFAGPDQTYTEAHPVLVVRNGNGTGSAGTGHSQSSLIKSERKRASVPSRIGVTASMCPFQAFMNRQPAQTGCGGSGTLSEDMEHIRPGEVKSKCSQHGPAHLGTPSPGQDRRCVDARYPGEENRDGAAPGMQAQSQSCPAGSARRRCIAGSCPAATSAASPLPSRSNPYKGCGEESSSRTLSSDSHMMTLDGAAVFVEDKCLSSSIRSRKRREKRRESASEGQPDKSQEDHAASQSTTLGQPGRCKTDTAPDAAHDANDAVSCNENTSANISREWHGSKTQPCPHTKASSPRAARASIVKPMPPENCDDGADVLPAHVSTEETPEAPRSPSSTPCPSQLA